MTVEGSKGGFLQLIIILSIFMWGANILMIGGPGQTVFILGDVIPSIFLGQMKSDYLMPVGFYYGFVWPFLLMVSYAFATKVKMPAGFTGSPRQFLLIPFLVFTGISTVALSTFFHLKSPW